MRLDPVRPLQGPNLPPAPAPRRVRFAPSAHGEGAWADLRARRFVCAEASGATRGGLRAAIDDAVELALALRGALPPRVGPDAPTARIIEDQVFRALALGAAGLAVALPPLAPLAREGGAMDPTDSEALTAWLAATRDAPVALLFGEADRQIRVLTPVPLAELAADAAPPEESGPSLRTLVAPPAPAQPAPVAVESSPPMAELVDAMAEPAPAQDLAPTAMKPGPATMEPTPTAMEPTLPPSSALGAAEVVARDLADVLGAAAVRVDVEAPRPPAADPGRRDARPRGVLPPRSKARRPEPASQEVTPPSPAAATAATAPAPATALAPAPAVAPATATALAPEMATAPASVTVPGLDPAAASDPDLPPPRRSQPPAARIVSAAEWRALAVELDEARGPKPVRVVEQLFVSHYLPLLGAALAGEVDAPIRSVVESWRVSFERSYRDAFSALRVTGKRPPMVLDAPDLAARIGRLNGARAVKLVLVDAMRFDLGERVAARLKEAMADRAVMVERNVLWSALPTTTATQLALLARGPDALREPPAVDQEPAIARGRALTLLRRERAGRCELMKLDLAEARLRTAGPPLAERLEGIAEEVSEVVARFMDSLPPRTLVLVFGDHGFRIGSISDGLSTGPATQGGASPEEVLMPAHAWLVGGVH